MLFAMGMPASAQVDDAPPAEQPAAAPPAAVAKAPAARPAPAKRDSIKGNAGAVVALVDGAGDCASPLKALSIINKSPDRTVKVAVEVLVNFMGRQSKKNVIIDNLNAGETRFVGCTGCVANQTGQTCTVYKIIVAAYK